MFLMYWSLLHSPHVLLSQRMFLGIIKGTEYTARVALMELDWLYAWYPISHVHLFTA